MSSWNPSKFRNAILSVDAKRLFEGQDSRFARALRWRLAAFQEEQTVTNLIRPVPMSRHNARSSHTYVPALNKKHLKTKKPAQYRFRWGGAFYDESVRDNVVFYESYSGRGALCNPFSIFEFLLNDKTQQHLEHVWSFRDPDARREFNIRYAKYSNVRTVKHEAEDYWKELVTAKYLFNNATFPNYFTKRPSQIYVNTWHGTPQKSMGYDSNEGAFGARNILRNFVQADYLVSPNSHTTKRMYLDSYKLEGVFNGKIIEQGYPRVDSQFADERELDDTKSQLRLKGIQGLNSRVVLYAPTWKGEDFQSPRNEAGELLQRIHDLEKEDNQDYCFLLKVHQQVYDMATEIPGISKYLVPNSIPTNKILAITDVLVTDYSSIYFDFLPAEKPIIFFTPDKVEYHSNRGVYFEDTPGPTASTSQHLSEFLNAVGTGSAMDPVESHALTRRTAREQFCANDDGNAVARIVDIVFNGNPDNLELISEFKTSKEKILIYLGGMRSNGITSSALNMLNNIDSDRFDVSIWAPQPTSPESKEIFDKIPKHVRQFLRQGTYPLTNDLLDEMNSFLANDRFDGYEVPTNVQKIFTTEWNRSFGNAEFDYVVDFSGYAGFWSYVLLSGPKPKSYSVWQHNDLYHDQMKMVDGKKPNYDALNSQFNAYRFFDNVVSVSQELMEINRQNLHRYAPADRFKFCKNSINVTRFNELNEKITQSSSLIQHPKTESVEFLVDSLLSEYGRDKLGKLIDARVRAAELFSSANVVRFVTAGRMSPEKNHARLIEAFSLVHDKYKNVELIILGDGALRSEIEEQVRRLGLSNSVRFTGMIPDALEIVKKCDCFVLSSDYEGQPMVILEASSLGIPVVSVNFGSLGNSLTPDRGIVVDQNADALAAGMVKFLEDEIPKRVEFDYESYNEAVVDEFYQAIGVSS